MTMEQYYHFQKVTVFIQLDDWQNVHSDQIAVSDLGLHFLLSPLFQYFG